jgi:iron complex transport system substrate-binding protein
MRHTARGGDAARKEVTRLVPRVVSLIASATEIVCALGCEESLVGRSHECDYPPSVRRLPVCTEPLIDPSRPSGEIDRQVKAVLRQALSVYRVHTDVLQKLDPDVIITQAQCEVCAVSLKDVERSLAGWLASRPHLVSLEPNALADVGEDIKHVAEALGVPERGEALVTHLQDRIAAVAERSRGLPPRPTVACIEWIDPLMAAGNWVPELVELAGGINLFGEAGKHSPWMTWPELVARDPDVIVVMPCGFDIARSRDELPALTQRPEWSTLRAVQAGRVYLTDGNQYFNRPGPRLIESLEILAELLHPETFRFGHEGTGWERAVEARAWETETAD